MTMVMSLMSMPRAVTSDENKTPLSALRNASVVEVRLAWLKREWISQTGYERGIAAKTSWNRAAARAVGRKTRTTGQPFHGGVTNL